MLYKGTLLSTTGRRGILQLLLRTPGVDVNAFNKRGLSALHLAAEIGHAPTIRLLLTHGAQPGQNTRSFLGLHFTKFHKCRYTKQAIAATLRPVQDTRWQGPARQDSCNPFVSRVPSHPHG
jgi:hypothetical protein